MAANREIKVAIVGDARDFSRAVDTTSRGLREVDDAARKAGETTDKTGSVMANFAGNAAQDLPGVAGSFGAVNVAVGQFAEYATEADIKLKDMVKAVGGMAVATVAIGVISSHFNNIAKSDAFNREQVDNWADRMQDGASAAQAMEESFREAGKVEIQFAGGHGGGDLGPTLANLGLSLENFTSLARMSVDEINAWGEAQRNAGADAQAVAAVMLSAEQSHNNLASAEERAAVNAQVFGESLEESREATEELTAAMDANRRSMEEQHDAIRDLTGVELSLEEAHVRVRQAALRYDEVMKDSESTTLDREQATLSLQRAIMGEADAARAAAETTANAQGLATTATQQGAASQIWHLATVASRLSPASDLRVWLDQYIGRLSSIPTNIGTNISISGNAAGPLIGAHAAGGPAYAGDWSIVGEKGPELVHWGSNATVIPNDKSMAMLSGGGAREQYITIRLEGTGVLSGIAKEIRTQFGGNVEKALGRA